MSLDGGITNLASWGANVMMPSLAGLFFAGGVYRYSKGGDAERLFYGGMGSLLCLGSLRTLEAFAKHAGPTGPDGYWLAVISLVNYVCNVMLPMYAVFLLAQMCLHMGGVLTEIYPGSVWIRKGIAALGALMISGILRLAEFWVNNAHAIPNS